MKKLIQFSFILILLFLFKNNSFGQYTRALKNPSSWKKQDIYLQLKNVDSTKQTIIYLINRSEKDYHYYGSNGKFEVFTEAKDSLGKWSNIDQRYIDCAYGLGYSLLPINHFSLKKKDFLTGDFETEIRYSVRLKDSIIYSKPFLARIPFYSFLDYNHFNLERLKKNLGNKNLTDQQKISYHFRRAAIYTRKIKDYEKAVSSCKEALQLFPKSEQLHFLLGQIYLLKMSQLKKVSTISKEEQFIILSEGFREFEIAHEFVNVKDDDIKKIIKKYRPHLPVKSNWNLNKELDCIEVDGKIKCFEKYFIHDYVEIVFRN